MRRPSLLTPLLLAAGCGGASSSAPAPIVCADPPAAVDPCTGGTCFTACGTSIAIGDAPFASGFSVVASPEVRPFASNRVGQGLVSLVPDAVQTRDGETGALEAAAALGGTPFAIAEAGGLAFVDTGAGVIYPVVVNDPEHPVVLASWRPTEPVRIVPSDNQRLILRTRAGVSLIDVTDPAAPVEQICLPIPADGGMDKVWFVAANAGFVAAAGGTTPRVYIYDLLRPTQIAGALPIDDETSVILYKGLLIITSGGRLIAYNAVPGAPLSEAARADLPASVFDPPVIGGFAIYGDVALDLDHGFARYDVIDTGGAACTVSLNAQDHSDSWFLAPGLVPDRRFALASLPEFACGPRAPRFVGASAVAHEPGGGRVLVASDDGLATLDDATNTRTDVAISGAPAWVGTSLVGVTTHGTDFNMPLGATITWAAVADPATTTGTYEQGTALVAWTADASALFLVVEATPRTYGTDPPAPKKNQVVRLDPAVGTPTPVALPSKSAPVALAAGGGRLWFLDAARLAVALDIASPTFAEVARADLDFGFDTSRLFASDLGLFVVDACGTLTWVDPSGAVAILANETPFQLLGADATRVYALVDDAPASTGLPGVRRLVAWAPTAVGDGTFTVTEQASMTIPDGTAAFTAGTPLGLALGGLYVLE